MAPGDLDREIRALHALFARHDFTTCTERARDLLRRHPNHGPLLLLAGACARADGDLEAAVRHWQRLTELEPGNADACNNLGVALKELGRPDQAQAAFARALAARPDDPTAALNLGNLLAALGRRAQAADAYRQALARDARHYGAWLNLGNLLGGGDDLAGAEQAFRRAIALDPQRLDAYANLAQLLTRQGRTGAAEALFDTLAARRPDDREVAFHRARLWAESGQWAQAEETFRRHLAQQPDAVETLLQLGMVLFRRRRYAEAQTHLARAAALAPGRWEAHQYLGTVLRSLNRGAEAAAAYERATALNPEAAAPRLARTVLALPEVAADAAASLGAAAAFAARIEELAAWVGDDPERLRALGEHAGHHQPFALAYRPGNHRALLTRYGDLLARAAQAYVAGLGLPPPTPPPPRERVRLAVVSGHIRRHSVWDVVLRGLIEHLDRDRFELLLYSLDSTADAQTVWARARAERFVAAPPGLAEWVRRLREDAPDVLFFPEIGMEPTTCKLALQRLAPLQAAGWGHPLTTGLPTIDLFFSGELLEGPAADDHYRERLVRLPGTGACTEPFADEDAPPRLGTVTLPADRTVLRLLISQQAMKLDPLYDPLLVEVVRAAQPCRLYLPLYDPLAAAGQRLVQRLGTALAAAGLDEVLVALPWQERGSFLGLLDAMDLCLDMPGFSGYTTAWQTVHRGLPIVTLEGEFLRQRLAAGLLRRIGQSDTIARDEHEYLAIVARLAAECRDPQRWQARRQALRAAAPAADHDQRVVRAFEQALIDALAERSRTFPTAAEDAAALHDRAVRCLEAGQAQEAEALLRRTLRQGETVERWFHLGMALRARGRLEEAVAAYDRALALQPRAIGVRFNRANALLALDRVAEAEAGYRSVIAAQPDHGDAYCNRGHALARQGLLDQAAASYGRAAALRPEFLPLRSNRLHLLNSLDSVEPGAAFEEHREFGRLLAAQAGPLPTWARPGPDAVQRVLRVGLVSPDFRRHSCAYFLEPLLEHYDRTRLHLTCYYNHHAADATTARLRGYADGWRPIEQLDDAQAAAQVRADRIDLLLDLAGHTTGGRLGLFARKPAPLQVAWLGYPNTTGLDAIDYRLTDAIADPPGQSDRLHTEQLVRLPEGFLCFHPPADAPAPAGPRPERPFTFGSFNNLTKLSDRLVRTWAELLRRVPAARLRLKARGLADPAVVASLRRRFAAAGVAPERLELLGPAPSAAEHLRLYQEVDLALDTFPYNGTTTTCEALWMGVPVLTLRGDRHAGRVGASLLTQVGLPQLIAEDLDGYLALAAALAADGERLAGLRERLRASPLGDGPGFARAFEAALRGLWARWCGAGQEPPHDPFRAGVAALSAGRPEQALEQFDAVLRHRPRHAAAHNNRGIALKRCGRTDEAIAAYRSALAQRPAYPQAWYNLAVALHEQGHGDEALECLRKALAIQPDYPDALHNLGTLLQERGQPVAASEAFRRVLQLRPDYTEALGRLVHQLQHLCAWDEVAALAPRVLAAVAAGRPGITPFSVLCLAADPEPQRRCAELWARRTRPADAPLPPPPPGAAARGRLRLGYLSGDFHTHATAFLLADVLELHDRERFELFGYSYGPDDGSAMRRRLVAAFDQFRDLRDLSDRRAAELIRADGIDLLVDLKGWTRGARGAIPAYRPAPVQVNFLGYPGTLGADWFDYLIADPFVVPPGQERFYSEQVVRLPDCYQPNDRRRAIAPDTPTRGECGLPAAGFVFCCFNNSYKITRPLFEVWLRLLAQVAGSVLWLLEGAAPVRAALCRAAQEQGVDPARLVFANRLPLPAHLARHRLADLFLDTLPVNAHTTASDALWAGLPVLTCAGTSFVGRVAGSLVRAAGCPELVTSSLAEYEQAALRLARQPEELDRLRRRLREGRDNLPLFDSVRYTRHLEAAYLQMWRPYTAADAPRDAGVEGAVQALVAVSSAAEVGV